MHPILFTFPDWLPLLGGHSIHIYGVMIALAFLFGMNWVKRESKRVGLNEERVLDLFFYLMIAGLVGSRILYVIQSVPDYWSDPMVIFRVWEGGLVFQGGVMGSLIVAIWYMRKHGLPFFKTSDVFVPALSIGHAMGRLGCFFAGCCYGKAAAGFPLAIVFPHIAEGIAPAGVPLYPTQLLESAGEVLIFTLLLTYRKKKPFEGAVFLLYLILYSILRGFVEILRGDTVRGFIIEPYLSNGQFISIISIAAAVFLWVLLSRRAQQTGGSK